MATWMISRLGLSRGVKWLLIGISWSITATYIITESTTYLRDKLFSSPIHELLVYIAVLLLLYHLNVLNKNTLKLAK